MAFNREEIIWAAGLFEGEGCFAFTERVGVVPPQYPRVTAQLVMTDLDVVKRFYSAVGVGSINGPRETVGGKLAWTWLTGNFEHVQYIMAMFWPWLGVRRRARIKEVLLGTSKAHDYIAVFRNKRAADREAMICCVEGCGGAYYSTKYCMRHYVSFRRWRGIYGEEVASRLTPLTGKLPVGAGGAIKVVNKIKAQIEAEKLVDKDTESNKG